MMESRKIIGREKELSFLEETYSREGSRFITITGRRRVGKTRLINEFLKGKDHFKVQFEKRRPEANLARFNRTLGENYNIPAPNFNSFEDCFRFLKERNAKLVVLDEFSYLIRYSDQAGAFQTIVDEIVSGSDMMLIVLGSLFTVMKSGLLEYGAPLYGRSDGTLNLQPLDFGEIREWFPDMDTKDLILVQSLIGGVPRYLELLDGRGDVIDQISDLLFDPNAFLFREVKMIMEEAFDDPSTYFSILEAISLGHTKVTRIANHAYIEPKNAAKYLSNLVDMGVLMKHIPFGHRRGRGIYRFKDQYFRTWYRFVSDAFEEIESGEVGGSRDRFMEEYNDLLGMAFEHTCQRIMPQLLDIRPLRSRPWWKGGEEIDWITTDGKRKVFVEIKWREISIRDAKSIFSELERKSSLVDGKSLRDEYAIVCRRADLEKDQLEDGHTVIDLNEIGRIFGVGHQIEPGEHYQN